LKTGCKPNKPFVGIKLTEHEVGIKFGLTELYFL